MKYKSLIFLSKTKTPRTPKIYSIYRTALCIQFSTTFSKAKCFLVICRNKIALIDKTFFLNIRNSRDVYAGTELEFARESLSLIFSLAFNACSEKKIGICFYQVVVNLFKLRQCCLRRLDIEFQIVILITYLNLLNKIQRGIWYWLVNLIAYKLLYVNTIFFKNIEDGRNGSSWHARNVQFISRCMKLVYFTRNCKTKKRRQIASNGNV